MAFSASGLAVSSKQVEGNYGPDNISNLRIRRRFWGLGCAELRNPCGSERFPLPRLRRADQHEIGRLLLKFADVRAVQLWKLQVDELLSEARLKLRWIDAETVASLESSRPHTTSLQASSFSWEKAAFDAASLDLNEVIADTNEWVVSAEFLAKKDFFESIEKSPLTDEQARAVITYDNRVQVVAAAGSGKTSVMVARAAYAVKKRFAEPSEILLLAFNRDAATELQARVEERFASAGIASEGIKASTFHALGLRALGLARGKKPSLAPWAGDAGRELRQVETIVHELSEQSEDFRVQWDEYKLLFAAAPTGGPDQDVPDAPRPGGGRGFKTFAGDVVKSEGERLIANWLYLHNVQYQYEAPFHEETADSEHSQYRPDFFYPPPDSSPPREPSNKSSIAWQEWSERTSKAWKVWLQGGTWHEHWGVDRDGRPPSDWSGYEAGMRWKKEIHEQHGSDFIETTWWGVIYGDDLERLKKQLKDRGHRLDFDPHRIPRTEEPVSDRELLSLLRTFISHAKSNSLSIGDLRERLGQSHLAGTRSERFLSLFERIFYEWEQRLAATGLIDFDDMLVQAAEHLEQGDLDLGYRLILADEFQDTSFARTRMLKGLLGAPGRHLLAVGDDWQSINRFAGADINSMLAFEDMFGTAVELQLTRTFRCPPEIVRFSSEFVQRNPDQIRKSVSTAIPEPETGSVYLRLADINRGTITAELERIEALAQANESNYRPTVLALGRYSFDRDAIPSSLVPEGIDFSFKTIHAAKGLEADYVLVLNLRSTDWGFPSTVVDDPILGLAMAKSDSFLFAEERRLFYVALTRAKTQVVLLTPSNNPSPFIVEAFNDGLLNADSPLTVCDVCDQGVLVRKESDRGAFFGCSTWPACDHTASVCPHCEQGCLVRTQHYFECNQPLCDKERHRQCPKRGCRGMLTMKSGPSGPFFGCSQFPACRHTATVCPTCGTGALVAGEVKAACDRAPKCSWKGDLCRECDDGIMVTRNGKHGAFQSCSNFTTTCSSPKAVRWRASRGAVDNTGPGGPSPSRKRNGER